MAKHTITGSGAPTTTPTELNQHYLDTVSGKFYFSKGTASSADWIDSTPTTPVVLGPELEAIKAAGGSADGRVPYYTGPGTASVAVFTTAGRNLVAGIDVTAQKTTLGLENVPNVDARARSTHTGSQTVSTLSDFTTEVDARITVQKGAANGLCPLDSTSKIASTYLPSYVDDVLEFANLAAFPGTGESGKIYVELDSNVQYRWSGSAYQQLYASPGSTDNVPEGSTNLYFTDTRAQTALASALAGKSDTSHTHSDATTSVSGFMSAADKEKLNTISYWTDIALTQDYTSTSNASWTTIDDWTSTLQAGVSYNFKARVRYTSTNTNNGISGQMTGTAGGTFSFYASAPTSTTAATFRAWKTLNAAQTFPSAAFSAPGVNILEIIGFFDCTSTGSLILQFRNETNGQTIVVKEKSIMEVMAV